MLSVADFISKYEQYSNPELLAIHNTINGYSEEAQEALETVIQKRGGIEKLLEEEQKNKLLQKEVNRIARETQQMGNDGIDPEFIKTITTSSILSKEQIEQVIDKKYAAVEAEIKDKKITSKTIVGSLVGAGVATIVGGTLWGLQLIYSQRIFYLFVIGLALLNYFIIKFITRQSKNNIVVVIATALSIILAILFGQILYGMIGAQ